MNIESWLKGERGRSLALASHLGVTQSRVSQFAADGVPVKYMTAVVDFTGGEVSLDELVRARSAPEPGAQQAA